MKRRDAAVSLVKRASLISAVLGMCLCLGSAAAEDDPVPLQPRNGIPLVIIRVDESEEAIRAASEADPKHIYGTMDAMNESEDHSVRCVGTAEVIVPEDYRGEYGSVSVPQGELRIDYIRGRGNTTWDVYANKKPHKFRLSEGAGFCGMGKNREWALIANGQDNTLLRNRITLWLGSELGLAYTPKMIPADLVMIGSGSGGVYLGSYCLSELVAVEESRVNIPKIGRDAADENFVSGGYLLSFFHNYQNSGTPESNRLTLKESGIRLIHEAPSFASVPLSEAQTVQQNYIRDYMNRIDGLIMTDEEIIDEARHNEIAELLDLTSLADYWWLQEFTCNGDAYISDSTFFTRSRTGSCTQARCGTLIRDTGGSTETALPRWKALTTPDLRGPTGCGRRIRLSSAC